MKKLISIALLVISTSTPLYAQSVHSIDLDSLSDTQRAQLVIEANKMRDEVKQGAMATLTDPAKLNQWVDLGKNVGLALTATAKELGVASDSFLNSRTGKIVTVLIVWKVMGHDILDIVGGVALWLVVVPIILWSYSYFFMCKKIVEGKNETRTIKYVRRYEFKTSDGRNACASFHGIAFTLITLVSILIVF